MAASYLQRLDEEFISSLEDLRMFAEEELANKLGIDKPIFAKKIYLGLHTPAAAAVPSQGNGSGPAPVSTSAQTALDQMLRRLVEEIPGQSTAVANDSLRRVVEGLQPGQPVDLVKAGTNAFFTRFGASEPKFIRAFDSLKLDHLRFSSPFFGFFWCHGRHVCRQTPHCSRLPSESVHLPGTGCRQWTCCGPFWSTGSSTSITPWVSCRVMLPSGTHTSSAGPSLLSTLPTRVRPCYLCSVVAILLSRHSLWLCPFLAPHFGSLTQAGLASTAVPPPAADTLDFFNTICEICFPKTDLGDGYKIRFDPGGSIDESLLDRYEEMWENEDFEIDEDDPQAELDMLLYGLAKIDTEVCSLPFVSFVCHRHTQNYPH